MAVGTLALCYNNPKVFTGAPRLSTVHLFAQNSCTCSCIRQLSCVFCCSIVFARSTQAEPDSMQSGRPTVALAHSTKRWLLPHRVDSDNGPLWHLVHDTSGSIQRAESPLIGFYTSGQGLLMTPIWQQIVCCRTHSSLLPAESQFCCGLHAWPQQGLSSEAAISLYPVSILCLCILFLYPVSILVSAHYRCGENAEGPSCDLHATSAEHAGGVPDLPPVCHNNCC